MSHLSVSASDDSHGSVSSLTPSSRLKLNIPKVSHTQIVAEELDEFISASEPTGTYANLTIIDVRTADYEGGHIKGSIHLPFEEVENSLENLIAKLSSAGTTKVVFIDLNGKQNSAVAAESFLGKFKQTHSDDEEPPQTFVVNSGFAGYLNRHITFGADKNVALTAAGSKLIAEFDPSKWSIVNVPRTPSNTGVSSNTQQVVYKQSIDSAHVFVKA